jgi:hypothetical protein
VGSDPHQGDTRCLWRIGPSARQGERAETVLKQFNIRREDQSRLLNTAEVNGARELRRPYWEESDGMV